MRARGPPDFEDGGGQFERPLDGVFQRPDCLLQFHVRLELGESGGVELQRGGEHVKTVRGSGLELLLDAPTLRSLLIKERIEDHGIGLAGAERSHSGINLVDDFRLQG